ncbi:MAG: hypothetical protein J5497_03355 [Selenomonadaceae bacterium]|nr:hypothetical protein [Selenomonadaceae bacterium]
MKQFIVDAFTDKIFGGNHVAKKRDRHGRRSHSQKKSSSIKLELNATFNLPTHSKKFTTVAASLA